jgi:hypothetical protein
MLSLSLLVDALQLVLAVEQLVNICPASPILLQLLPTDHCVFAHFALLCSWCC